MSPDLNILINADDLGYSNPVNRAILHCFRQGLIQSASLMTGMPAASAAISMFKGSGFESSLGVHVNLTEGKPVSDFKIRKFLNQDGTWNKAVTTKSLLFLGSRSKKAFYKEISAQVQIAEDAGLIPSHINSHHHVHTQPAFFPLFLKLGLEKGYPLRIAQTYRSGSRLKGFYRDLINRRLRNEKAGFSAYFETLHSFLTDANRFRTGTVELMVHPVYSADGSLTDSLDRQGNDPVYKRFYEGGYPGTMKIKLNERV